MQQIHRFNPPFTRSGTLYLVRRIPLSLSDGWRELAMVDHSLSGMYSLTGWQKDAPRAGSLRFIISGCSLEGVFLSSPRVFNP